MCLPGFRWWNLTTFSHCFATLQIPLCAVQNQGMSDYRRALLIIVTNFLPARVVTIGIWTGYTRLKAVENIFLFLKVRYLCHGSLYEIYVDCLARKNTNVLDPRNRRQRVESNVQTQGWMVTATSARKHNASVNREEQTKIGRILFISRRFNAHSIHSIYFHSNPLHSNLSL